MNFEILQGDSSKILQELTYVPGYRNKIDSLVTSVPYFQKRDYLEKLHPEKNQEIGCENSITHYLKNLEKVFKEAKKLLKINATVFVNIGETFKGGKALKIPSQFIDMMEGIGYYYIQEIIWAKSITTKNGNIGSCKPESVNRRFTNSHEYVLFFVLDLKKFYLNLKNVSVPLAVNGIDPKTKLEQILVKNSKSLKNYEVTKAENPTLIQKRILRNKIKDNEFTAKRRSVWQIPTPNSKTRHTAVGPIELFEICILAGTKKNGTVLDPFTGEGTVGKASLKLERDFLGIDLDERSCIEAKNNLEETNMILVS
ncbi:DNA-methyltransferase [Leptospira mayottensis]|uniref:Methyltransferase n=1 Tax=Leptospira mayottensis 200901122 TaxID=1193010 RepID=A0AA87MJR5_9LEPT|nr:site-specific DNA-methyltransferase [Leptospira mayottensis]AZQ04220.1 site-specific DNA-methyltransferase [Leptospira mayottensis 200901116]EKR98132.1 DNA methylase family protein [Leptospira mayottensis 200901122]TGN04300.1 site-specific DNA-methyltransferase [Leptospira mayottensis]